MERTGRMVENQVWSIHQVSHSKGMLASNLFARIGVKGLGHPLDGLFVLACPCKQG